MEFMLLLLVEALTAAIRSIRAAGSHQHARLLRFNHQSSKISARQKLLLMPHAQSYVQVPGAAFGPVGVGACAGALPLQLLRASANEAWLSSSLKSPSSREGPLNAYKASFKLMQAQLCA